MTDIEIRLLRLIPVGSDRPISTQEVTRILEMTERGVRDMVSRLITKYGVPIVAKRGINSGYYIPRDNLERLEGIRELQAQHQAEGKRLDTLIMADLNRRDELLEEYGNESI
ncbi:DNA-binding protein [Streptococcus mitis]|nr:DNA-binding protein [Streptococcus sp. NLN76]